MTHATAYIIAGGKSSRMGGDKALLQWHGTTLLDHAIALASGSTNQVKISGNPAKYGSFAKVVADIFPESGPLAGIHASLRDTSTELNLVLAVDIPFVQVRFLRYLLGQALATTALVTVPHVGGRFQPLCAVYRPAFADIAEQALQQGRNKIDPHFTPEITRIITEDEIERLAFPLSMFDNLNTREEFEGARARTEAHE